MINLTEHAKKQAKQRFKLKSESLLKLAERAMEKGITHSQKHGKIKRYFDKLFLPIKPRIISGFMASMYLLFVGMS